MKINKETFDKLPAGMQAAFKPVDGNPDQFDNGEEDAGGLKSALEKEKAAKVKAAQERDALKGEKTEAEKAAAAAKAEADRKKGDFSGIEAGYKTEIATLKAERDARKAADLQATTKAAQDKIAAELAKGFVAPAAMLPYINTRLATELVDGEPLTRILDADGKPTAKGVAELQKEFLDNTDFKGILVASKGNGGGATKPNEGGGSTSEKGFKAATAAPADLVAHLEAKGVGAEE